MLSMYTGLAFWSNALRGHSQIKYHSKIFGALLVKIKTPTLFLNMFDSNLIIQKG